MPTAPRPEPLGDDAEGGDAACWLDQVRDCCGSLVGEPHRRGCQHASAPAVEHDGRDHTHDDGEGSAHS